MVSKGQSLAELTSGIQKMPQTMINVPLAHRMTNISGSSIVNDAVKSVQDQLGNTGRVILRASGTEPLIRVTLEGIDEAQVNLLAKQLADVVQTELAD